MKARLTLLERAAAAGITMRHTQPTSGGTVQAGFAYLTGDTPMQAKSASAQGLYVVLVNGKRVDSFLTQTMAHRKIRELLGEAV